MPDNLQNEWAKFSCRTAAVLSSPKMQCTTFAWVSSWPRESAGGLGERLLREREKEGDNSIFLCEVMKGSE